MLDPDILAAVRIGPACDVAGSKDSRSAGLEVFIDGDASVDRKARALGELDARTHPDADDDEIGRQVCPAFELDALRIDPACGLLQMKDDAVLLVERTDEVPIFTPEHALQRSAFRCHDVNLDLACPQRCRHLEPDKARPDDDRPLRLLGPRNDRA
jgi:hypothetical protein